MNLIEILLPIKQLHKNDIYIHLQIDSIFFPIYMYIYLIIDSFFCIINTLVFFSFSETITNNLLYSYNNMKT